ncbi:AAA family ATPase [Rhizobium sp. L1K21]|uniref:AAA family ATPase n=1 Tax=Rhizobium sp. L1K21 TaxID=2954933 RepID=UPI0020929552|nr:AAA family ATPase [Rhizobium sp. L1K21]MCO6184901.1 AAA family ATPase [Rhizobium sp. L1K21]
MLLKSMSASQYRSLRSIRMELDDVNVFIGANGVGKTNLYRALQLVQAAVQGNFAFEIAAEGGMAQTLWAGPRRKHEAARVAFAAEVEDETTGMSFEYRIAAGLRPPIDAAGFVFEPQVKEETLSVDTGRGPVVVMERKGPGIFVRDERGRMRAFGEKALVSETAISLLAHEASAPEVGAFCRFVSQWRFFHGFRTDADSPLRRPCLAVTSPLLDEDGGNLAAVFATVAVNRGEMPEIDAIVAEALDGAALVVQEPEGEAFLRLSLPEFPHRVFDAREFSDGQLRFLALTAALMSYRLPPLVALNEPEASLHPSMLDPLADLIAQASLRSQIWVVTHSEILAEALVKRCGIEARRVIRRDGATWIEGMRLTGTFDDGDDG